MDNLQLQYTPSYIQVISENFPELQVQATGDGREYLQLQVVSPGVLPDQKTLDGLIQAKTIDNVWRAIQAVRDYHTQQGGSHVGNYWFHSDQPSRTQQIALVLLGANIPAGLMWKTMSGVFVPMNQALAMQVFLGAVQLDQTVFATAETHHQRMMASPTPWSYDFSTGWPEMYEEAQARGETP